MSETETHDGTVRRAKIHLSLPTLADFIDLPKGLKPVFAYATSDPSGIYVIVEGDQLAPASVNCELPTLPGGSGIRSMTSVDAEGRPWRRIVWDEAEWAEAAK